MSDGEGFEAEARAYQERPTAGPKAPFSPYARPAGEEWEWRGDEESGTRRAVQLIADPGRSGNSQVSVALARIPAGNAAPWHFHHDHEEFVYVLEGAGEFWCAGELVERVAAGSVNLIPPRTWHTHRATDQDLVFVWGYAPPGEQLAE